MVSDKCIGFSTSKLDVKKREYIYDIEKQANHHLSPTHYSPERKEKVTFCFDKSPKVSIFKEISSKKLEIPSPQHYNLTESKRKIPGNYLQ